jgi:hypothetical protein
MNLNPILVAASSGSGAGFSNPNIGWGTVSPTNNPALDIDPSLIPGSEQTNFNVTQFLEAQKLAGQRWSAQQIALKLDIPPDLAEIAVLNPSRDNINIPKSPTMTAQAQAGLVAFGPVGLVVAVGITGITISVWLNTPDGQKFLGEITNVVGRGVDGTIEELKRILEQGGKDAVRQLKGIENLIRGIFRSQNLVYEPSEKHGSEDRGDISRAPADGQEALDNSVQVKDTSTRRVGVDKDNDEIVVFDETHPGKGIFHGHVRPWDKLTSQMQDALKKAGLVDKRGRILK